MNFSDHKLIIVTPVYEDIEASSRLFQELATQFQHQVFVIAVDDGSVRQPLDVKSLTAAGLEGTVIKLRRNVGHQRAIAIGLNYVADNLDEFKQVVVMDSDGEDVPSTIQELLTALDSPAVDVVVAQRKSRVETLRFRAFYAVYKRFFRLLTGRQISFGNFMALKPAAVKRLAAMQEVWVHVAASTLASKLRIHVCPLDRGARYAGHSKMNFVGLVLHGFRGLMVFTEDVLVRVGIACALVSGLSMFGSATVIILKLIDYATPGWFSIALGVLFLVFLQTGTLTLMTLMLTGIVRGESALPRVAYKEFIDAVQHTSHSTK